jgi:hypothetical protein
MTCRYRLALPGQSSLFSCHRLRANLGYLRWLQHLKWVAREFRVADKEMSQAVQGNEVIQKVASMFVERFKENRSVLHRITKK